MNTGDLENYVKNVLKIKTKATTKRTLLKHIYDSVKIIKLSLHQE